MTIKAAKAAMDDNTLHLKNKYLQAEQCSLQILDQLIVSLTVFTTCVIKTNDTAQCWG